MTYPYTNLVRQVSSWYGNGGRYCSSASTGAASNSCWMCLGARTARRFEVVLFVLRASVTNSFFTGTFFGTACKPMSKPLPGILISEPTETTDGSEEG